MRALPLRRQLLLAFSTMTLLLLAAFAASFWWSFRVASLGALDRELRARAEGLAAVVEWDDDEGRIEFEPSAASELAQPGAGSEYGFELWHSAARIHAGGLPLPPPAAEEIAESAHREQLVLVTHTQAELRTASRHVLLGAGGPLRIRVGVSLQPLHTQLQRAAWQLLIMLAAASGLVAAAGLLFARRLLRPVRALSDAAGQVRPGALAPMPRRGTGDELDQLAEALDRGFAALEAARERQRRFTANAAHELRNPVAALRSLAEVASRRTRTTEQYAAFFADVATSARRMQDITEALLLLARLESGEGHGSFERLDLCELAGAVAAELDPGTSQLRIAGDPHADVHGNETLLRVLLRNLLQNALEHGRPRRPIELRCLATPEGTRLEVRNEQDGLEAAACARIFERFYRAPREDARPRGAGLGLALVGEIAAAHGAHALARLEGDELVLTVTFGAPA